MRKSNWISSATITIQDDNDWYEIELELTRGSKGSWDSPPEPASWSVISIINKEGDDIGEDIIPGWTQKDFEKRVEEELSYLQRAADERDDYDEDMAMSLRERR